MTGRTIGIVVVALAVAGGLAYGFLPRPVPVDVARAERGALAVTVEEEGKTRVMDRYVISAPMSGYVRRIGLKVGDRVARGQVLAVLEPARSDALDPRSRAQAMAQVKAAEANLAAAAENARALAAEARLARQEMARAEKLGQAGFFSGQAVDQARTQARRTEAAQQAAEHQISVARYGLETARAALARSAALLAGGPAEIMEVRAPAEARVLKLLHESEGTVPAGQPLLEIGNPENLEVEVEVLSGSAVRILPGSRVILDRWGGARPLEGRVRMVEPTAFTKVSSLGVEEQRVRVIVDLTSPRKAWETLGDGYRVEAVFVVWEAADVLQLPTSALFRHNNGWAAFAVREGQVRLTELKLGQRNGLRTQILSGIKEGDRVVIHPGDKLRDGSRVRIRGGEERGGGRT